MQPDSSITHRAFFGDTERIFTLRTPQVIELERQTGVGVGALFARLAGKQFKLADIAETIRLGLIGGGCDPQEAASLIAAYVQDRPFSETFPLAIEILSFLWFGNTREASTDA